ncbi:MAG: protein kinase [Deltaproteobacteria bacterium]|nr:protein kinase [Deltaproteobacteria bacterium]
MPLVEGDLEHYPRKFGKYHLLGPLAQGGMGALYLAVAGDRGLERLMVIKTVLPHLADSEYVARFRDEAKVVVKLSHGNLIPVFDAGLVSGELFLAMDFVEGRDLRAVWNRCAKKQVAFPIDVAVYIVKELCRGLAYAHSFPDLNLVHRDISPPNVLVSYTGEVKLTDFGLASSTLKLEKTAPGIIYGKVAYMSPEQARGEKLDGRSDMYATAIVLWELLTGRQLFPPGKDQPQDLLSRAKNPEVMRPSKRAPRVPIELDEICLRALASAKEDRYENCDEMRMALQTWLAHNAPTTDGTRMSTFLAELFAEDIHRERGERSELISRVRTRALTLPPTDELRQMIEKSDLTRMPPEMYDGAGEAPVRRPGSVGRRATDRGDEGEDRRREMDRRASAARLQSAVGGSAAALAQQLDPEAEPDLIGSEVDGRYRVIELIGEGGMGKVYLAEHVEIGKRVALKVLHPSYSRMPDLVERFRREARAASKIGHPNIVDVTDSGTTGDGSVYFVMEFLEGVELGSIIEREGAIEVARCLRIASQICRALAAAHAQGIVHRDLKPENVFLITRDGATDVVKVLDFGIAKTTEAEAARERRLTSPGMAMGTPEYMSPEQAAGRPADARCDVYALGAIIYEMVTGNAPYSGENFMEILTKKATQDPPPPSSVRQGLSQTVSDLVMSAMARDPDDRPQTMETFEYELNKALAGRGVAVAHVLGMTTDPNVVATLNPGLSMRNLEDDGAIIPRSATSSPVMTMPRAATLSGMTEIPSMLSGPASMSTTGQHQAVGLPSSEPRAASSGSIRAQQDRSPSMDDLMSQPVVIRRSAAGALGWLLLGAVLFGGIGTLLYVALGERNQRAPAQTDEIMQPAARPTEGPSPDVGTPATGRNPAGRNAPGDAGSKRGSGISVGSSAALPVDAGSPAEDKAAKTTSKDDDKANSKDKGSAKRPTVRTTPKKQIAVADEKDPKALIKQGKALERTGDWEQARGLYMKLEKIKGHAGQALYMQAWAAFQSQDTNAAVALAKKSAEQGGPQKTDALFLYGDALFRRGETERAKVIYLNLRTKVTGDLRATATKKIAACNKALKLPDADGIAN